MSVWGGCSHNRKSPRDGIKSDGEGSLWIQCSWCHAFTWIWVILREAAKNTKYTPKNMNELVDKLFSRLIVIIGSYKVLIKLQRDHFLEVILISELEESIWKSTTGWCRLPKHQRKGQYWLSQAGTDDELNIQPYLPLGF